MQSDEPTTVGASSQDQRCASPGPGATMRHGPAIVWGAWSLPVLPTGTVTFLFTDMEGSTRLLGRLGDEARRVFDRHLELIIGAVAESGGTVVRTEGDAVFAVFTSAPAAVCAAVAAQWALQTESWGTGDRVWVRMGVHTGEGVAGSGDYHGIDVHRAARISDAGNGGQVLVSDTTKSLVGDALPQGTWLRDLGMHRLRDIAQPERLYQLETDGLRTSFPPLRAVDATPNNLPIQLTSFVGRRDELAEVVGLLRDHRLLTLTGPGGTGKTRLALQAAAEATADHDGVYWVPLASVHDADLVPSTVMAALGLAQSTEEPIARLGDFLGPHRWLLVLDNFEQILDAGPTVAELLGRARELRVLVTSRAPLHVSGEQEFPVPPLDVPTGYHALDSERLVDVEAVRLFVERARVARPGFELDEENAAAVAEIVARLDGLPLAIELAAARVKLLPPQTMVKRLGDTLDLLVGGRRDLPERQRTLRGAIAWSADLLDPVTRTVFERLAVFRGGASLDAVEGLCPEATLDRIELLADHSLIRLDELDGESRVSMLETIREYAATRLESSGIADETRDRHLEIFLTVAEEAAPGLVGFDQRMWLERLERELDNLRAALTWAIDSGRTAEAARLLFALWRFWHMRGPLSEGRERAEAVLAMAGLAGTSRLRTLEAAGGIAYWRGDFSEARVHYEAAAELAREMDDPAEIANALYNMAFPRQGRLADPEAAAMVEEALAVYRRLGDTEGTARALWGLGTAHITGGRYEQGLALLSEALEAYSAGADAFHLGWTHRVMAVGLLFLRRPEEARPHIEEAMRIFGAAHDMSGILLLLRDCAEMEAHRGNVEKAVVIHGAVRSLQEELGLDLVDAFAANNMPTVDEAIGDMDPERVAVLLARGAAMSIDEAMSYASPM